MPVTRIRNYMCVLASALTVCAPAAAEEAAEAIARCARIATVGDRILCLENALRQTAGVGAVVAQPDSANLPEVDDEVMTATQEEQPAEPAPEPVAETPGVIPDTAPVAAATTVVAAAVSAPVTETQQPDLGAEQIDRRSETVETEPDRIDAIIIEHELVLTGRLRLTLDNGQVWQQTTDDDRNMVRYLKGESSVTVEMWKGRSGGYRMYLVEADRTLRVRRLK